jgi:hypothetical protein
MYPFTLDFQPDKAPFWDSLSTELIPLKHPPLGSNIKGNSLKMKARGPYVLLCLHLSDVYTHAIRFRLDVRFTFSFRKREAMFGKPPWLFVVL